MELISREETIQKIREMPIEYFGRSLTRKSVIIGELEGLPTIESRAKGRWKEFSCSLCGFTPLIKPMAIDTTKGLITCIYKYCPACGAEMECEG